MIIFKVSDLSIHCHMLLYIKLYWFFNRTNLIGHYLKQSLILFNLLLSVKGPGGLMSQVVGLPNNSFKPITNTAWVRARLCKLQKGCTRLAKASDTVYELFAHAQWFSPSTLASSTTKTSRHDIAEILLKVVLNTKNQSIKSFIYLYIQKDIMPSIQTCRLCILDLTLLVLCLFDFYRELINTNQTHFMYWYARLISEKGNGCK